MLLKRSLSSLFGRFKRIYRFRHSPSLCFLFSKIQGLIPLFIGDDSGLTSICEICEYPWTETVITPREPNCRSSEADRCSPKPQFDTSYSLVIACQAMVASCLNISLIELKLSLLRRHYKSCGLKSELVKLNNDTTMHCWTPTPLLAEAGVWSVPDTRPPLLLIQGFAPHAMLCWENQVASLVKEYNVYIPDLLFFGSSITTCKQRSEAFQAECMVKMLQHLGVRNEVDVVGTSYGGFVAFRMAQMFPEFVNKIVFSSSGVCMSPDNNEPLLEKHGLHHISQILIPTSVAELKIAISSATYKTPWLPNFLYQDMLEVSLITAMLKHVCEHTFSAKSLIPYCNLSHSGPSWLSYNLERRVIVFQWRVRSDVKYSRWTSK